MNGPERIVCLTEETTEWLYLLGGGAAHRRHLRPPWVVLPVRASELSLTTSTGGI